MNPTLARLFEEYADAHRHPMNRLTHKVAIPLIVFHVVAMLHWVPLVEVGAGVRISLGHVAAVLASAWYLRMSVKLGLVMVAFIALCFPVADRVSAPVVVALAVIAWVVQLAGHAVWEKRSPAFLRNLMQALVGPLFFVAILLRAWPARERSA